MQISWRGRVSPASGPMSTITIFYVNMVNMTLLRSTDFITRPERWPFLKDNPGKGYHNLLGNSSCNKFNRNSIKRIITCNFLRSNNQRSEKFLFTKSSNNKFEKILMKKNYTRLRPRSHLLANKKKHKAGIIRVCFLNRECFFH